MPEHQQIQQSKKPDTYFQKQATHVIQTPVSNPYSIIQRARINPKSLTRADVMQLQRTIGNQAVGRLLSSIGNTSTAQQATVQRQEIPEEKGEETCPSCMQRQENSGEEEPLQGKFEDKPEIVCPSCFAAPIIQKQESEEEEEPLQGKMIEPVQRQEIPEEEPLQTKRENKTGIPDNLKAGVESLSGVDMSNVRVHYNSYKPAEVGALAYTQGTDIHVAPGQERHLPHETWHVVQQKQDRVQPTMQMKDGIPVNDDGGLEHEADVMGAKVMQMKRGGKKQRGGKKPAKLHIHVDLDAPDTALIKQLRSGEVGHAWISLQWKDPTKIPHDIPGNHNDFLKDGGVDPMGFWPKMFESFDPVTEEWTNLPDDERSGYSQNPFKSYVPGQMVHPDTLHSAKATQSYDITHEQANAIIKYAESKRDAKYSVFFYNCTTFAKEAAEEGGQSPPSMGTLGICYPDALYKSIVKNQEKRIGTTQVKDSTGHVTTVVGEAQKKG